MRPPHEEASCTDQSNKRPLETTRHEEANFITGTATTQDPRASRSYRFKAVWSAHITPPSRKLVMLAMTQFADSDGTNIRPSVASIADMCQMSPNQARIHMHALRDLGVLTVSRQAVQNYATTYALNFEKLSALQSASGPNTSRAPAHEFQGSSPRASGLQRTGDNPGYHHGNDHGDNRGAPRSGSALAGLPDGAVKLFTKWRNRCRWTPSDLAKRVERLHELVALGHDIEALIQDALDKGWERWPMPPKLGDRVGTPRGGVSQHLGRNANYLEGLPNATL